MDIIHYILEVVVETAVLLFESIGMLIIIYTGLRAIYDLVKDKKMRHHWLKNLSLGLSFLLIAEILETIMVRSYQNLIILSGVIILRSLMLLLMHWEMSHDI
ncbi:MAG TPA: DUF1622 domain-containing protein [Clostridiales bacterium]|nr:DUF1622 domain-containing protein [Clostridiales bacterium]